MQDIPALLHRLGQSDTIARALHDVVCLSKCNDDSIWNNYHWPILHATLSSLKHQEVSQIFS